jgi:hypothetical protein
MRGERAADHERKAQHQALCPHVRSFLIMSSATCWPMNGAIEGSGGTRKCEGSPDRFGVGSVLGAEQSGTSDGFYG